jgi:hypothetical protein
MNLKDDPQLRVKLTGNWETVIGEQDTFVHILEYENYSGYDKTIHLLRTSEVRSRYLGSLVATSQCPNTLAS